MRIGAQSRHLVINGARIYLEEAGVGDAVVLLHGGLGDSRLWDAQFEWFSTRYRTIRYDMRFFGKSSRPSAPYSLVDDLVALLDTLEIDSAALIGLSLGGRVAIDTAIDAPARVAALVAVCSDLSGFTVQETFEEKRFAAAIEAGDTETAVELALNLFAPLGATELMRQLADENLPVNALPPGAVPAREPISAVERLGEISSPTLVVTGNRDLIAFDKIAEVLHKRIPNADRLRFDSDHYLPLREGTAFNEAVDGFLRRF